MPACHDRRSVPGPLDRGQRQRRRFGVADDSRRCACGLCARARRRRRHASSVHGGGRRAAWPGAASPRCATSSRPWSAASSGPIRRASPTPRCAPRSPRRRPAARRLPLFAGGKSFGGRMTSQAQAEAPLAGVAGLVFLGFPLHPAGRPGDERGEHLAAGRVPDAVRPGQPRRARRRRPASRRGRPPRRARDAGDDRRCRPCLPRPRAQRQRRRRGASSISSTRSSTGCARVGAARSP